MSVWLRMTVMASALAAAGTAWAEPTITASKPFGVGAGDASFSRAVVGLKDGGALYAFGEGRELFVRPVGADRKLKPATQVSDAGGSAFGVSEAAMARLKNGNVVTAWAGRPGPRNAIFARVTAPGGGAVSAELSISADPSVNCGSVSVASLGGGGFAVAWGAISDTGETSLGVRVFKASGVGVGSPVIIVPPEGSSLSSTALAPDGPGFMMTYVRRRNDETGVMAQRYSALAKTRGKAVRLDDPNDRSHQFPKIAARIDGGHAVVWQENVYSSAGGVQIVVDTTLKGRLLTAGGDPAGRFAIEDAIKPKSLERAPALVDTDQGLLVAWHLLTTKSADKSDNDVRGTLLSTSGVPGPVVRLTRTEAASEAFPRLAPLADGRVALGYGASANDGDSDPHGALGAFLVVRP